MREVIKIKFDVQQGKHSAAEFWLTRDESILTRASERIGPVGNHSCNTCFAVPVKIISFPASRVKPLITDFNST